MHNITEKCKKIRCLISDVDGVLTNGMLYLNDLGIETKGFYIHDGMGLMLLMAAGIEVAIITTSLNPVIEQRMQQLNIRHYFTGQRDKRAAYAELKHTLKLTDEQFAYVGDDLPDIGVMRQVGLGVAVANAVDSVKKCASFVSCKSGGDGAVREVCDMILLSQNKTELALAQYLKT